MSDVTRGIWPDVAHFALVVLLALEVWALLGAVVLLALRYGGL